MNKKDYDALYEAIYILTHQLYSKISSGEKEQVENMSSYSPTEKW